MLKKRARVISSSRQNKKLLVLVIILIVLLGLTLKVKLKFAKEKLERKLLDKVASESATKAGTYIDYPVKEFDK